MSGRTCPACKAPVPPGAHFCVRPSCQEFLGWEDTGRQLGDEPSPSGEAVGTAATGGPSTAGGASTAGAGTVAAGGPSTALAAQQTQATITLLDEDAHEGKRPVAAGERIAIRALVRNQSVIVDRFTLSVCGFEDGEWWTVEPNPLYLLPFDTGADYEQEVHVRLHPPRSPSATARAWPIAVIVTAEAGETQAQATTTVVIEPFESVLLRVDHERIQGRRRAHATLTVKNDSNHRLWTALSGAAKDEGAAVRVTPASLSLEAGEERRCKVTVSASKRKLVGQLEDHELVLQAAPAEPHEAAPGGAHDDDPWAERRITFRQRSWLPWWSTLIALAALAAIGWLVNAYLERVPVPNVIGNPISPARDELKEGHVKAVEVPAIGPSGLVSTGRPNHAPVSIKVGEVFREEPEHGTAVAPGSKVKLLTATAPGSARVPELFDLSVAAAESKLARAGFAIGNIEPYPPPKETVVVEQTPSATRKATPDREVVDVEMGQVAVVPNLLGKSAVAAEQALRSVGLVLSVVSPRHPPSTYVIGAEHPKAGEVVRAGAVVEARLVAPPVRPAKRKAKAKPKPKQPPKAKPSAPAAAPLPALAGSSAAAAAAALAKAGLHTRRKLAISATVAAGRLLRTEPAPGAKLRRGATVTLVLSAGFPEVAADDGRRVLLLDGVTGKRVATIAGGPAQAVEPSWSPNGRQVAYVSSGRVMLIAAHGAAGPRALTPPQETFAAPTFPPDSSAPAAIAAIGRLADGVQEVCLLAARPGEPSCIPEPGWTLTGSIGWSPTGTTLLVAAARPDPPPGEVGLLKLTSRKPFSLRASDWRPAGPAPGPATPTATGAGVLAGAFSPDGGRVALVEDLAGSPAVALVAPSDLTLAKASRLAQLTPVCAAQFRADSAELLLQVGSGAPGSEGACAPGASSIYRVPLANPGALSFLARGVAHPSWQPLPGVG